MRNPSSSNRRKKSNSPKEVIQHLRSPIQTARGVASQVLYRLAKQESWLAPALNAEITKANLDTRDAGLATAIAYGTARFVHPIDECLKKVLTKPLDKLDAWVHAVLRISVFQLFGMDKQPTYAVIHDAVSLVKAQRGQTLGKLTNAVLRKLNQLSPEEMDLSSKIPIPTWVWDRMVHSIGKGNSKIFVESRPLPPPIGIRISKSTDSAALIESWRKQNSKIEVFEGLEKHRTFLLKNSGRPQDLKGYKEGAFSIQEEGAQLVGSLISVEPNDKILDVCAGRGGKTCQLAEQLGEGGRIDAVDLYDTKLEAISHEFSRLGRRQSQLRTFTLDFSVGVGNLQAEYDHVLVDAPCTGLGTFHRRPEILWRTQPDDLRRMAELQVKILIRSASLLKVGGSLTYAVCSFTSEEGEEVAKEFEEKHDHFERIKEQPRWYLLDEFREEASVIRIGPWLSSHQESPDAYQVIRWIRTR